MTRFKEALNELRGKYAAKTVKKYRDQHMWLHGKDGKPLLDKNGKRIYRRPVRGTPATDAAAEKATRDPQRPGKRGGYNDTVNAASQGLVKKPGGETVTAGEAARTMSKAAKRSVRIGKRAVARAKEKTPKATYGTRKDKTKMALGRGGRGDAGPKPKQRSSITILGDTLVEAFKERYRKATNP